MNTSIPSRARSFVSAILALSLGFSTTALARPMNAYENGEWIGDKCETDSRGCAECIGVKCGALYSTSPNLDICILRGLANCNP